MVTIKSEREIDLMRKAGRAAAECLDAMMKLVKPGATGTQIERACNEWMLKRGYTPATLGYKAGGKVPFPASLCYSPNDVVCHGIPDKRPIKNGDLINLDVTPIVDGFHGDTNATVMVGTVKPEAKRLVETTYLALWDGIRQVRPGASLGDIGHAIQKRVEGAGYTVVLEFCGHGLGRKFHEDPSVPHVGRPGQGLKLREGMTFTIEPMVNAGARDIYIEDDAWTVRTEDGSLSAQFEHSILVTPEGFEVLTLRTGEVPPVG